MTDHVGRYRIMETIGEGGMGIVFRAADDRLHREVAIKMLPAGAFADEDTRRRFHREARLLSQLNHPNIAALHDFDSDQGREFLVMEYVPGRSLRKVLEAGPLSESEALPFGVQLADALACAHDNGILHRDLKPGNLRIRPDGTLKVLDFGLAHSTTPRAATTELRTTSDILSGTLSYMAPEVLMGGESSPASDVYALGLVLYEMATGALPFSPLTGYVLFKAIVNDPVTPPRRLRPELSPGFEATIMRAIEKRPEDRFRTARELHHELKALAAGKQASTDTMRRMHRRRRRFLGIGVILALIALAVATPWVNRSARGGPTTLVAVLPFKNLSADPEQEYFSDGLTEEMIARISLANPKRLGVIARTSVLAYKDTRKSLAQIGRELNVAYVLEGTVRRAANQLRIVARLSRVRGQIPVWTEIYDRPVADVFDIQSDVADRVSRAAVGLLFASRRQRPAVPTRSIEAHEAYLRGRYHWNRRTEESLLRAAREFESALAQDSTYAEAHAGLADTYLLLANYGFVPPALAMPRAAAEAKKALALDPDLASAYATEGAIAQDYSWNWEMAEERYRRSIAMNAGYPTVHQWYADLLAILGRFAEARRQIDLAYTLDPLSISINADVAAFSYYERHWDDAIRYAGFALDLDSTFVGTHQVRGLALLQKGLGQDAITSLQRAMVLSGAVADTAGMRAAFARDGVKGVWKWKREWLLAEGDPPPYELAGLEAQLGAYDRAFQLLAGAFEERSSALTGIKVDPQFDPIRSDPRYEVLLRRMRLPIR